MVDGSGGKAGITAGISAGAGMSVEAGVSAGILAGGKSSRMGTNKALLRWQEQTMLEHLAKLLASERCVRELLVSVERAIAYQEIRQRWQGGKELVFIEDDRQDYGPLEGLYQLLSHGKYPWLFVAATDLPLLCPEFIRGMLQQIPGGAQAVIPRAGGRVHPLCGLYAKSALPVLEHLLRQEEHKVKALLQELHVHYVDVEGLGLPVSVLENVNTPEEYKRLNKKMSKT